MRAQQLKDCGEGQHREEQEVQTGPCRLTTQPEHKERREQRRRVREHRLFHPDTRQTGSTQAESSTVVSVLCFSVLFYFFFDIFNGKVHYHVHCYRKCIGIFLYLFRHRSI